ncbi:MAG: tetratricopeptide repeat protein [Crocinitomicaceae bacterium]|nr:tetratricopeptide repeat protein [Crocinitomicaceae bacterium]
MKALSILLLLWLSFSVNAQINERLSTILKSDSTDIAFKISEIQSLITEESGIVNDTVMVEYYLKLSRLAQADQDYLSAIDYCDTLLNNYPKLAFEKTIKVKERKASIYKTSGQTDVSVSEYLSILSEYEDRQDFNQSAKINNRLGIIFLKMNDLENAEYHLIESIDYAKKINNKKYQASSLMSLGNRYKKEGKFEKAENYYKLSISICKSEGFKRLLAGNYNNYGSSFRMQGNETKALSLFNLAVKMNKELGNDQWLSYNYNNIGNVHNSQGNHEKALEYFFKSNEIKTRLKDYGGMSYTYQNISSAYDSLRNYKLAHKYYVKFTELKDSLAEIDNALLTKKLGAEFQAEKREAKIIQLNMQRELDQQEINARDERISYQNFLAWLLGLGIFLLLLIAIIIWRSAVGRKRTNEELIAKNEQIDAQHSEIIGSINYAKRIQSSILPSEANLSSALGSFGLLYKPKDIVSGDFYLCEETENGTYFSTIDCTGHGVPGAMVSLVASSHLERAIHELKLRNTGAILNTLNADIPNALNGGESNLNDGFDIALCKLSKNKKTLNFSGANLNCWILNTRENIELRKSSTSDAKLYNEGEYSILELKGQRRGVGKSYDKFNFSNIEISLEKGDKIIISTDGYQDQFGGERNKKFKVKEMRNLILKNASSTPKKMISILDKALITWQGNYEQVDDICIMIIEV